MSSVYPSVSLFFNKTKSDRPKNKNSFVASKLNETIQKTLDVDCGKNNAENVQSDEIDDLRAEIKLLSKELKQAKVLLRKANDVNMQKDFEIAALKKQLNSGKNELNASALLFEKHVHQFDPNDMKKIRSIKSGMQQDSTFILNITKALYKNEEIKLKNRRATSRKYKDSTKLEISAEKKAIMQQMLQERVNNESEIGGDANETAKRLKRLNEHMRHALKNSISANENKRKQNQNVNTVNTNSTPKPIQPVFLQANDSSSTPATPSSTTALQNTDTFHSFYPSSYPVSPIYSEPARPHTSQPPQYFQYYSPYQQFPSPMDWTQNRNF